MPPVYVAKSGTVRISVSRNGEGRFVIAWYPRIGQPRKRETFSAKAKACDRADEIATSIAAGQMDLLTLTSADRDSWRYIVQAVAPLRIPPHAAVEDYVAARASLPPGRSIADAVAALNEREKKSIRTLPPSSELAERLVHSLETHKVKPRSHKRCRELRHRLAHFTRTFPDLATATTPEIERYLLDLKTDDGQPVQAKTHDHHLAAIQQLYHYAEDQHLWPAGEPLPASTLPKYYLGGIPATFTAAVLLRILAVSDPYWIPWLVLGAFAGLRPTEIFRLSWEHIRWGQKTIAVPLYVARKIGIARLVPMSANLLKWLAGHRHHTGRIYPGKLRTLQNYEMEYLAGLRQAIPGLTWTPDVLRHSFGSYRLAQVQSIPQVVLEMGTSAAMLKRFYNDPKTPAEARKWFAILPAAGAKNIVPMRTRA